MGIGHLFLTGLPDGFFGELSRSARAFLAFLQRKDDTARVTSQSEPFFDAVVCGDAEAEQGIARHSRASWHEGEEYEDDFLYFRFLMERFTLQSAGAACEALLERHAAVLGDRGDPRLDVCRALLAGDAGLFEEGFDRFLDARTLMMRKKLEAERVHPDDASTTAHLSVEVLALLCFAERAGLTPDAHLSLAPSVVRRRQRARLPHPDAWCRPLLAMDGARRAP
nr:Imm49 family immunity protein [Myxococcus sp. RHSTA-1-4]